MHQLYSYIYLLPRPQQSNKPSHDTQALTSDCSSLGVTGTHDGQSTRACLKGRQLFRWPSKEASRVACLGFLTAGSAGFPSGDVDLAVGNKHSERLIGGSHQRASADSALGTPVEPLYSAYRAWWMAEQIATSTWPSCRLHECSTASS